MLITSRENLISSRDQEVTSGISKKAILHVSNVLRMKINPVNPGTGLIPVYEFDYSDES